MILYTGRQDNIGEVARKIVGKQHSLELNPNNLQYKINRDSNGKFKNIEFVSGEFVGLSVLGDSETPAFTGSGFFTTNEDFKTFAAECHDNFDRFLTFLNKSGGNIEVMEFNFSQFLQKVAEAKQLTMQEFQGKIYEWLGKNLICGYVIENTEDYAVVQVCNEDSCKNYKYQITVNGEDLELSNPQEVYCRYLTKEEIEAGDFVCDPKKKEDCEVPEKVMKPEDDDDKDEIDDDIDDPMDEDDDKKKPDCVCDPKKKEDCVCDPKKKEEDYVCDPKKKEQCEDEEVDELKKKSKCEEITVSPVAENPENGPEGVVNATATQETVQEEEFAKEDLGAATAASASATTLSDSERLELEGFRKQAKVNVVNEYRGDIKDEDLDGFIANIDNYSIDTLRNELNAMFRAQSKQKVMHADNSVQVNAFQIMPQGMDKTYNEHNPADVINRYKK